MSNFDDLKEINKFLTRINENDNITNERYKGVKEYFQVNKAGSVQGYQMKYRREYNLKVIGTNLKYYREKNNFSVEYVRKYLRLGSKQAIYKWENGKGYPQTDTMFSLMELYGIGLKEILEENKGIYSDIIYMFIKNFIYIERNLIDKKGRYQQLEKRVNEYYRKYVKV